MAIHRITAADDPRIADYALVGDPQRLRQSGLFVAEGRLVVRRLLEGSRFRLRSLLVTETVAAALNDAIEKLGVDLDVNVAPIDALNGVTGFNIHRGCLALAERPAELPLAPLLASSTLLVIMERVVDADNVGSLFRNAAAFGVNAVVLSPGCCDPLYRKAVRTSSGAALSVPFSTLEPWPAGLDDIRRAGFAIAAMTPHGTDLDIGTFVATMPRAGRVAVLVGTEGDGLTDAALEYADLRVRIPIACGVDSLNVATAAAIALQRISEVRR